MKTIYTHRPCFFIALCFAAGIFLSARWNGFVCPVFWITSFFLGVYILSRWQIMKALCLCAVFIGLGYVHAQMTQVLPPEHMAYMRYEDRRELVEIQGVIVSDVDSRQTLRGSKTSFELSVERLSSNGAWQAKKGKVLVNLFRQEDLHYGDRIVIKGKLHKPFSSPSLGHFSYEEYLKRNGVYWMLSVRKNAEIKLLAADQGSVIQSASINSRHYLKNIFDEYLNDIESGVMQSLVLGGRYHIPDSVRDVLVSTGTAHILAISGMNIGAVAFLIVVSLGVLRVPRNAQLMLTILFLMAYAYFTGANPSVVRATVMAVIFVAAFLIEREQESLNSLGIAALVILLFDPMSLLGIGFQLSFMGVFAIVYFYPRLYALFDKAEIQSTHRIGKIFLQALCLSFAAWIGVAPLIAYYFQIVTPVTVLANLPIIPFVSALMMLGIGLIAASFISPWLTAAFAACVKVVFVAMMLIIDGFGRVPFGHWPMKEMTIWMIAAYYLIVFVIFYWIRPKERPSPAHEHTQFFS